MSANTTTKHQSQSPQGFWLERQLAHKVPRALGTAYNRTQFIDDRHKMMQVWADYLDRLKEGRGCDTATHGGGVTSQKNSLASANAAPTAAKIIMPSLMVMRCSS